MYSQRVCEGRNFAPDHNGIPPLKPERERQVVALDPGVRSFQTFYSPGNDFGSFASGGCDHLDKEMKKCDQACSALKQEGISRRQRKKLEKSKFRAIERVKNLVSEVHKKVANDLCTNYDTIMLPVFASKQMVKKAKDPNDKPRVISAKTARLLLTRRHFQFREYLKSKAIMRGKELVVVTEEYTTQCCGQCGNLKKNLGGSKVYKCAKCSFVCGRDENAARNIFLKYLKE